MVSKYSWSEFRETGLLWFINTILHMFGWAICIDYDNNEITDVYPARVKFRGFSEDINTSGYIKVSKFIKDNCEELLKEAID